MKRYAIKFPDGTYSKGAKNGHIQRVPFEKAKLWTNIGHIKNHLNGLGSCAKNYPRGCEIIEVVISHTETTIMTVGDALDLAKLNADKRKAEYNLRNARCRLREAQQKAQRASLDPVTKAQRELDEALAKAERLGLKVD
jgi:hypothetical protein